MFDAELRCPESLPADEAAVIIAKRVEACARLAQPEGRLDERHNAGVGERVDPAHPRRVSAAKAREILGWTPARTMDEGLALTRAENEAEARERVERLVSPEG